MCLRKWFQKQTSHRCQQHFERFFRFSNKMSSLKSKNNQSIRSQLTINLQQRGTHQDGSLHQRKWIIILQEKKLRLRRCPPQHWRSLRHLSRHLLRIRQFHWSQQSQQEHALKRYQHQIYPPICPSFIRPRSTLRQRKITRRISPRKSRPITRDLERKYPRSLQWLRQLWCWSCPSLQWPKRKTRCHPRQTYRLKRKNVRKTRWIELMYRNPIRHCSNRLRKTPKKHPTLGLIQSPLRHFRQRIQLCHRFKKTRNPIGSWIRRDGWEKIRSSWRW